MTSCRPIAFVVLFLAVFARADAPVPEKVDFNRDVRPILSDNCFACHGFDKNARKASLRLDIKDGIFGKLEEGEGHVVVAGNPDQSEVVRRITHADASERMPPKKFNKPPLTARQVEVIKRWIEQGAEFKGHWAYIPPARPEAPAVDQPGFVRNPIDRFILAKLKEHNLAPSGEADKVTLVRRLYFDLIGLPPTKAEVDAFVNDASPDAYEKLVEKLLASPHFGERMAMYWLDVVRYGDSIGYHSDNPQNVYPFREYVINAFNANKPFDRFTIEQLAGDLLPNATTDQKIASTYNRLLQTTEEGGAQPKEYAAKYSSDRVRSVTTAWLGQTLMCSECHDHKFDPFTQADFYSLAAFFADIQEAPVGGRGPGVPVPTAEQESQLRVVDESIAAARQKLEAATPELAAAQAEWEKQIGSDDVKWTVLDPESWEVHGESKLKEEPDGILTTYYKVSGRENYKIVAKTDLKEITGFRLEALNDPELPSKGPGTAPNGNFVLTEFKVSAASDVKLQQPSADHSQEGYPIADAIDGKGETGWAILPQTDKPHFAIFEAAQPVSVDGGDAALTFTLEFQSQFPQHNIGKLRLSATADPSPSRLSLPPNVKEALAIAPEQRSEQQKSELAAHFRTVAPQLQVARDEVAKLEQQKKNLEATFPTSLVSVSGPPREIRILPRGNWLDDSGPVVQPAVPAVLGTITPKEGQQRLTRLELAEWLVRTDNPLTARVFMNRLWKLFYGTGISKTLEDMGSQGEWPTHPELLDYLATEFVSKGWDVKQMVRVLVTSGTYRQTSKPTRPLVEADPFNRLLARQSRFRMDAEMVRDNALAISGLLVHKLGGKSVFPYQPAGYWQALNFPPREWQNGTGDDLYRRGMYTHWQRTFPHPSLTAFDAPSREEAACERPRSNIPQQALVLLNDPTYVEASRIFAERIIREGGASAVQRIGWAFATALSRAPAADEVRVLAELQAKHQKEYESDVESAKKVLTVGAKPADAALPPAELASWTSVARTILNLHETITRR